MKNNKDRIAVVYEDQQLTYEVLNQRANQLGYYLKKHQVKPEILVGISVPRGLESDYWIACDTEEWRSICTA